MRDELIGAVLDVVDHIPVGRVTSYGAIAAYLAELGVHCSARQVGQVMARHGGAVAWNRVVAADGRLPPGHEQQARALLEAEGVRFNGDKVTMSRYAVWPGNDSSDSSPKDSTYHAGADDNT